MSSQSATGSGIVIKEALKAIMKRLDTIENKMQPRQPLQDKVAGLKEIVRDHTEQQRAVHTIVERVEMAQRSQVIGHLPNQGCHRTGDDDDDDQGGNFLPTAQKLEFPKFNSVGDPLPWLN
jgi:hypothetical protein